MYRVRVGIRNLSESKSSHHGEDGTTGMYSLCIFKQLIQDRVDRGRSRRTLRVG